MKTTKPKKKRMNAARRKVLRDMVDQQDESVRMSRMKSPLWKLRGLVLKMEYWIIAFNTPIAIALVFVFGFWEALAFYIATLLYVLSGNIRGLLLHIENYIEWQIGKTV